MLIRIHSDKKYIPGYWHAEAISFAIDANVFDYILMENYPEIGKFLANNFILPETYCQKWFSGLCIHVLNFKLLMKFILRFLQEDIDIYLNLDWHFLIFKRKNY